MKKFNKIIVLYFVVVGIIIFTSDDLSLYANTLEYVKCGSATGIPKPVPQLTTIAYTLLVAGTPIILIAFSIITLVKAVVGGNADEIAKARTKLFKKFIIAAVIFLSASIVQFVLLKVTSNNGDSESVTSCLKCFLYYSDGRCPASETGNDIKKGTHGRVYSNLAQPTTSNRKSNATKPGNNSSNNTNSVAGNYLKFHNALSVLHSGQINNDNTVSLFKSAGEAKFFAAECDLRMNGTTLYCAHDTGPSSATKFEEYLSICKKYGMTAIIDIKYSSGSWSYNYSKMLNTLADYIKNNNLQNTIIIQTVNIETMNQINSRVSGVKYWYLIDKTSGYNSFNGNITSFKNVGVVGVNMQYTIITEDIIKGFKNNGLKVCVYSVDSDSARSKYSSYGVDYIMTNSIS